MAAELHVIFFFSLLPSLFHDFSLDTLFVTYKFFIINKIPVGGQTPPVPKKN